MEEEEKGEANSEVEEVREKKSVGSVGQEQVQDLLFSEKLSWQAIIYDLINTEQLDPWNIDLSLLSGKYLEKVRELEEANFFVSSKVLLAASLLLRIKSEILLSKDIQTLDDILFGKKDEKKYSQERIELDDEIPELVPRTPLPRFKKVSLHELMSSLGKAIQTETRRIQRVVVERQREYETQAVMPKNTINIRDQIKDIYSKLRDAFSLREERLAFSELVELHKGKDKMATFVPLLHLDHQHRVLLEQEGHLEEIWIWLKSLHERKNKALLEVMRKEVEVEIEKANLELTDEEKEREENLSSDFKDPLGELDSS
ncbi:hypothetical protein CMI45_01970 [Candidatus Pacearchaeota archaeon]|nr:hypothetical protein [Candidatus Pacearchaeota archaeon]|tara:strand:+ start:48 stop:992 length:945 start_codon:yes stop_codon:yes gene_type:complete